MSIYSFKKYVKSKTREVAFNYLIELKNQPGKQTKMMNLNYYELGIQEYLLDGNKTVKHPNLYLKPDEEIWTSKNTKDGNIQIICA